MFASSLSTPSPVSFGDRFSQLSATIPNLGRGLQWWSVRALSELAETLSVRAGVAEPPRIVDDVGAMVTVLHQGAFGYAATADLSPQGLAHAFAQAQLHAEMSARWQLFTVDPADLPNPRLDWRGPSTIAAHTVPRRLMLDRLLQWDAAMASAGPQIVDRRASVTATVVQQRLWTAGGGDAQVQYSVVQPALEAYASNGKTTQRRTNADTVRQGGLELLDSLDLDTAAVGVAVEAVALVHAPNCPTARQTLVLAPDQMMLQIHESIGHPLELDRILGDERNFAGTSFVTPAMFGSYAYGSELLTITFDPSVPGELVSLPLDDFGTPTKRELIIANGILQRPLGGQLSQDRANLQGVATSRACSWNRPPIDRMSNLNLEPGTATEQELIAGTERGILLRTNLSWSIDDSRNKFQFGCEVGQLIEDGELRGLVRNPCYRGVSATFWRNLNGVAQTRGIHGTPYCGKGEPAQIVRVGHASPMCRFADVDVFGAEG